MTTSELVADGGRTLVVKRADPAVAPDAARLTREATLLAMARHPGVVELVGPSDPLVPADRDDQGDPTGVVLELRTLFAGARTLAAPDLDPRTAARALAVVAATVADLHALGLVHGRITPDHVVLTGAGRAVLCGFAEAGLAGDVRSDGEVLLPSLDVASLGSVLGRLLAEPAGAAERRHSGLDRGAVARLVDRATDADPRLRPSARTFATALAASLPRAPEPRALARPSEPAIAPHAAGPDSGSADPDAARGKADLTGVVLPTSRGRRLVAATGALVAVVWLGMGFDALGDGPHRATTSTTPSSTAAVTRSDATTVEQPPTSEPARPGGELDLDGRHLTLGTPADQVVRAVWSCSGPEAVVLVRPDGSVFRFDGLAVPGHDVTGVLVGRLPPRAIVELVTGADGCTQVQARATDRTVTLSIPSLPSSPP